MLVPHFRCLSVPRFSWSPFPFSSPFSILLRKSSMSVKQRSNDSVGKPALRGVVFDMDGTLTVPVIDFSAMHREVLGDEGYAAVKSGSPGGSVDILHRIETWEPHEQQRAYEIIADFERQGLDRLQIMPGAVELCGYIDSKQMRRGLITRNVKAAVDLFQQRFGLKFVPALSREFRPYKPNPAPLLHICSSWGIPPNEVMMIGDSLRDDVTCGKQAGAFTCLLDESGSFGWSEQTIDSDMSAGELLEIEPAELKFPFELRKQISCSLQLSNKTDDPIAFKVKTTNPKKYCVRPNNGIVLPRSTCDVVVTMQAQREAPADIQCKDKFLVQSAVIDPGTLTKDITAEMFSRESGNKVDEVKLRVVYVSPPQPPSPVNEGSDEGSSPRASVSENNNVETSELVDQGRAYVTNQEENYREAKNLLSKFTEEKNTSIQQSLTEEKNTVIQQCNKLQEEIELLKLELSKKNNSGSFSFMFVLIIALLGVLVGYFVKA